MFGYPPPLIFVGYSSIPDDKIKYIFFKNISKLYYKSKSSSCLNSFSYCFNSSSEATLASINSIKLEGELQPTLGSLS